MLSERYIHTPILPVEYTVCTRVDRIAAPHAQSTHSGVDRAYLCGGKPVLSIQGVNVTADHEAGFGVAERPTRP